MQTAGIEKWRVMTRTRLNPTPNFSTAVMFSQNCFRTRECVRKIPTSFVCRICPSEAANGFGMRGLYLNSILDGGKTYHLQETSFQPTTKIGAYGECADASLIF